VKNKRSGVLLVISAPSGTGKSTVTRKLIASEENLAFSVSYTTRGKREGEVDGQDYRFVDQNHFAGMIEADSFIEWADVFDHRYGTGKQKTLKTLDKGQDLLLDIDVQGARQVRESGVESVSVFIFPPDYATLVSRLKQRGSESEDKVRKRLSLARSEGLDVKYYDYVIVNDDLERAVEQLRSILASERLRVGRRKADTDRILATFPEE
jgi:guanylate kinase